MGGQTGQQEQGRWFATRGGQYGRDRASLRCRQSNSHVQYLQPARQPSGRNDAAVRGQLSERRVVIKQARQIFGKREGRRDVLMACPGKDLIVGYRARPAVTKYQVGGPLHLGKAKVALGIIIVPPMRLWYRDTHYLEDLPAVGAGRVTGIDMKSLCTLLILLLRRPDDTSGLMSCQADRPLVCVPTGAEFQC